MIEILKGEVARKTAAGEVIDRPYAVTRELLDNAIDAGADKIDVSLFKGGIGETRVTDNGTGMSRKDLKICFLPHATSKIHEAEDLYTIHTLGFRGEALSSIAATSRLEIISKTEDADSAFKLVIREGVIESLSPAKGKPGTTVSSKELFYSVPGRRRFLKSYSAEATMSRNVFIEKSLPFPAISFRLFSEGTSKLQLSPSSLKERVLQAFPGKFEPSLLLKEEFQFPEFSLQIILGSPELIRRDRRYLYTYVNNRRVQEYSILQAVEYGYKEYLPGGFHPIGFVFLEIDPEYVDFNIHPAKKEVRFRNLPEVHHQLVGAVQSMLSRRYSVEGSIGEERHTRPTMGGYTVQETPSKPLHHPPRQSQKGEETRFDFPFHEISLLHRKEEDYPHPEPSPKTGLTAAGQLSGEPLYEILSSKSPLYLGQIFSLFLLAEYENRLYIIDQHAAHERIIYNELKKQGKKQQSLLFPLEFCLEEDEHRCFIATLDAYKTLGFTFKEKNPDKRTWEITSLPAFCTNREHIVIEYVKQKRGKPENLEQEILAEIACKEAIKDGEQLDPKTGSALVRSAIDLPRPRCPHGRPIWYVLSREDLFSLVARE